MVINQGLCFKEQFVLKDLFVFLRLLASATMAELARSSLIEPFLNCRSYLKLMEVDKFRLILNHCTVLNDGEVRKN